MMLSVVFFISQSVAKFQHNMFCLALNILIVNHNINITVVDWLLLLPILIACSVQKEYFKLSLYMLLPFTCTTKLSIYSST